MTKQKEERLNLILKLLMALLFISGVMVFSYPFVVDSINNYYDQKVIEALHKENQAAFNQKKAAQLAEMTQRNKELAANKKSLNIPGMGAVEDPFASALNTKGVKQKPDYYKQHTIGAIYIPKIHVSLPLFDETTNELLEVGATVLQGSSFPIGGENSHSVITGHSGLPDKKLLTDLNKLELKDVIYIEVGDETLAYEVNRFKTVLPDELDDVKIQNGRDLVTLVTCTPYMVNTHRLLVTAHRIPYSAEQMKDDKQKTQDYHKRRFRAFLIGFPFLFGLIFYWMWRKFVYYQSGKYTYDFIFTVHQNSKPVVGEVFVLTTGKDVVRKHKKTLKAVSDVNGEVCFHQLPGGKYWARPRQSKKGPMVKGYIHSLKDKQFVLRGKRESFKTIKTENGKNYLLELRKKK